MFRRMSEALVPFLPGHLGADSMEHEFFGEQSRGVGTGQPVKTKVTKDNYV